LLPVFEELANNGCTGALLFKDSLYYLDNLMFLDGYEIIAETEEEIIYRLNK